MKTESWSSTRGFLMATVGAAVGLGNLWRFPYIAGSNGGSAFVLVYVGWVLVLGVPLVIGELALGRRGGLNAVHTMREVALSEGRSGAWGDPIGWLSILVPLLGITYYSIVAGWSLNYMLLAAQGTFRGITAEGSQELFGALLAAPLRLMFWHGLFIAIVVTIIAAGVRRGAGMGQQADDAGVACAAGATGDPGPPWSVISARAWPFCSAPIFPRSLSMAC